MSFESRQLRDALGCFATGVCLVTTVDTSGAPKALTVNSFASVSLDPPLVLWSLQRSSDAFLIYAEAPRFAIAVLGAEHEALSNRYATKGGHALAEEHFRMGANGAPLITGALVNFECSLERALDGGDHVILLGRVTAVQPGDESAPLIFFSGNYRELV